MSFILDALKKSESDRQRQSGPSLFEVKVAPPRRALPVWAVAIGVLLAINVIVISWMLLRHPTPQRPAAANPPAAAPAPAVNGAAAPAESMALAAPQGKSPPAAVSSAPTAGVRPAGAPSGAASAAPGASSPPAGDSPRASPIRPPEAPALAGQTQQSNAESAGGDPSDYAPAVQPAAAQPSAASASATGDLPLYQQIVTSAGLPALHLDLHVFAQRPQDRFVMINMHRLAEGDSLPGGVQVEAIRPDGVVLSYRGTRFLLPRN